MAIITRTDAEGIIPIEISNDIIQSVTEQSVAMKLMKRLPDMSAQQLKLPVVSQLPAAGFVEGDTGLKMTSKQAWEHKYLFAEEIATIVPVPEAVYNDSSFDIWEQVKPTIAEAMAAVFDKAALFGIGKPVSWPEGVVKTATTNNRVITVGTNEDIAGDVSAAMGLVEGDGYDVNGFAADISLKSSLRGLRDLQNNPIFQPSLTVGTPSTLYAQPIEYVKNGSWDKTQAILLAGDFTKAVYSMRQDITFKVLDQAVLTDATGNILYNLAQQDMIALRVVMRIAWQVANPVNRLNENKATAFPFAIVKGV